MSGGASSLPVLLVVDDEQHILASLQRTLRREGWSILTAESASEALRLLDQTRVDAVLSDQKMPGTNGLALLREVARRRPATARLLLTGWPGDVPPGELEAIGVRALISKPWDDAVLKRALRELRG